ncbi:MAG: two-component sensor histidine kinase, partial [Eudoraea sp.]|nr:two-component sensor histidine kinase [Eudoraea sp.]
MSLSLIGIISVQLYWIKSSVEDKEEQFSSTVTGILNRVTDKIESREINNYSERFLKLRDSMGEFKSS